MENDQSGICKGCLDKVIDMTGGLATVATGYCPHLGNGYMLELTATGDIQKATYQDMTEAEADAMRDRVTTAVNQVKH